jgi:hypothetical protein
VTDDLRYERIVRASPPPARDDRDAARRLDAAIRDRVHLRTLPTAELRAEHASGVPNAFDRLEQFVYVA